MHALSRYIWDIEILCAVMIFIKKESVDKESLDNKQPSRGETPGSCPLLFPCPISLLQTHETFYKNKPILMKYLCFPWGKEKASELRDTVVTLFPFLFRVNTNIFSSWGIPCYTWVLCQSSGTRSKDAISLLTFPVPPSLLYCTFLVYCSLKTPRSSQMPWKLLGIIQFEGQWSQLGMFHWLQLIWIKLPSMFVLWFHPCLSYDFQAFVRWRGMMIILE